MVSKATQTLYALIFSKKVFSDIQSEIHLVCSKIVSTRQSVGMYGW